MDYARVVEAIAGFLEREGAPLAVAGGFALHAYGWSRATNDIDFVTDAACRERLVAFLESLGYETLHSSPGFSNHLHAESVMGRVDVIYVDGETAKRLFATRGASLRFGSREVAVPRAEHVIAMKVHAMKHDPRRTFQDMADIRFLLGLPGIDEQEIRGYFEKAGLAGRFDEIKRTL